MLNLYVFNSEIFVQGEVLKEHQMLSEVLSWEVPGWEWMVKKRKALVSWDGYHSFYDQRTGTFPAGLLPLALKKLAKVRVRAKLHDQRVSLSPKHAAEWLLGTNRWHAHLELLNFHPDRRKSTYQVAGVREALENQVNSIPWPRGIVQQPTGSGKTALSALFLLAIGRKALFLVERLDLLRQTSEVFERILGCEIGRISEGDFLPRFHTVSTIQTVIKKLEVPKVQKYLRSIEVIILDECQNLTGSKDMRDRYLQLLAGIQNAPFRFAISGTPLMRGDLGDIYLRGAFGSIISRLKAKDLVDQGMLARPVIRMIRVKEPELEEDTPGSIVYDLGIVHNLKRNLLVTRLAAKASKKYPTMILVNRLAHARMIQELLKEAGLRVPAITYKTPSEKRGETIKQFEAGELQLLISSSILEIGINVESLRFLIVASGGRSAIKALQRLGRGMRKKERRNQITLVDFLDESHSSLEEASHIRLGAYRKNDYEVKILRSKKCLK